MSGLDTSLEMSVLFILFLLQYYKYNAVACPGEKNI